MIAAWRAGAAALLLAGCAQPVLPPPPPAAAAAPQPEVASGWTPKPGWQASRQMVAAAHPLAADAGLAMLRAGGSALDAAIAAQMVLALVEPQSSGIGGGAFLMVWDGHSVSAWDGRETAPALADERQFLGADGRPVPFPAATLGGRAVATPGVLRMLQAAHREQGQLPWARLFQPAIHLADDGFRVGPRLHALLLADTGLRSDPRAAAYFFRADGSPQPVGHLLRNPAMATLLRAIAMQGPDALYRGPAAAEMVQRVRAHAVPGRLSEADLAAYAPRRREPLCTPWRELRVCGMPPPSSGHLAMMQTLGMLEHLPAASLPAPVDAVPGAAWLHAYTEAARLAFADRALHVADPDFTAAPGSGWASLLDSTYLAQRAALVGEQAMPTAAAGQPPGTATAWAAMPEQPEQGTSHISVIDARGRAVALTTSIESAFGARIMADGGSGQAGGYLLNNQMTDFAFAPTDAAGRPVANRIQPGKRPRSSMSPTLVFDGKSGELLMTLGAPGGAFLIHFTARTLLAMRAWGLSPQAAIDAPNFGTLGGPLVLEAGRFPAATAEALRARGHRVTEAALTSGVQAIRRDAAGLHGGADPRREGVARGD